MLLAGVRRQHAFADVPAGIPAQWRELEKLGALPGQLGGVAYGAICGADVAAQRMEYLCGYEVAAFESLPKGIGRMRVPAGDYAVFWHAGDVADVRASWQYIFATWLPRSGMESAHVPDFERYDERFDPLTGRGGIELWVGVVPPA